MSSIKKPKPHSNAERLLFSFDTWSLRWAKISIYFINAIIVITIIMIIFIINNPVSEEISTSYSIIDTTLKYFFEL